ncbi:MAG: hypothetical protein OXH99_07775 [Bryobacterales bacterium]|nr:hypothetical protein [Bryobacterales bacterium]
MTSRLQSEAVWKSMLHYESLQRYYTFVGERLARRRQRLAHMVLTASSGAALALLAGLPLVAGQVLALVVAALVFWLELAGYSSKSARSLGVAADLGQLASEMHALWINLDELEGDEAQRAWRELDARAAEVTRHVPADLLRHHSLQDRAEDETYGYWAAGQDSAGAEA